MLRYCGTLHFIHCGMTDIFMVPEFHKLWNASFVFLIEIFIFPHSGIYILGQNVSHTVGKVPTNPTTWSCSWNNQSRSWNVPVSNDIYIYIYIERERERERETEREREREMRDEREREREREREWEGERDEVGEWLTKWKVSSKTNGRPTLNHQHRSAESPSSQQS